MWLTCWSHTISIKTVEGHGFRLGLRINDPGQAICGTEDVPHLSQRPMAERHYRHDPLAASPCLCGALSWRSFDLGQAMTTWRKPDPIWSNDIRYTNLEPLSQTLVNSPDSPCQLVFFQSTLWHLVNFHDIMIRPWPQPAPNRLLRCAFPHEEHRPQSLSTREMRSAGDEHLDDNFDKSTITPISQLSWFKSIQMIY